MAAGAARTPQNAKPHTAKAVRLRMAASMINHQTELLARGEIAAEVEEEEEAENGPQNRSCDETRRHPARPRASEPLQAILALVLC